MEFQKYDQKEILRKLKKEKEKMIIKYSLFIIYEFF